MDVGVTAAQNAWIAGARLLPGAGGGRRVLRVDVAAVGAEQDRTLGLTGLAGLPERSQAVTAAPGRPTPVDLRCPRATTFAVRSPICAGAA